MSDSRSEGTVYNDITECKMNDERMNRTAYSDFTEPQIRNNLHEFWNEWWETLAPLFTLCHGCMKAPWWVPGNCRHCVGDHYLRTHYAITSHLQLYFLTALLSSCARTGHLQIPFLIALYSSCARTGHLMISFLTALLSSWTWFELCLVELGLFTFFGLLSHLINHYFNLYTKY